MKTKDINKTDIEIRKFDDDGKYMAFIKKGVKINEYNKSDGKHYFIDLISPEYIWDYRISQNYKERSFRYSAKDVYYIIDQYFEFECKSYSEVWELVKTFESIDNNITSYMTETQKEYRNKKPLWKRFINNITGFYIP